MGINKEGEERKRESILRFGLAHAHTAGQPEISLKRVEQL